MGMDPAELRRKNFILEFPYQTPVIMNYDCGDFPGHLEKAQAAADVAGFAARKAEGAARGKLRGLGYSTYIEACGIAPSQAVGSLGAGVGLWESAEVRVNPVGTIEVLTGSHSHGQGHETSFAQVVADRFDLPVDSIQIVHGDTDKVQFGMGTYGSRSGYSIRDFKGLRQGRNQGPRLRHTYWMRRRTKSSAKVERSRSRARTRPLVGTRSALPPIPRTTCPRVWNRD